MWRGHIGDAVPETSYVNNESERPLIDTEIGCMVLARRTCRVLPANMRDEAWIVVEAANAVILVVRVARLRCAKSSSGSVLPSMDEQRGRLPIVHFQGVGVIRQASRRQTKAV